jgi:hypothetical protein
VNEIGTGLHAAVKMDAGLMTIMANLSDLGYTALKPVQMEHTIIVQLWEGFRRVVKKVLLPLAEHADVIHPDIRPGYDVTSNLLLKFDDATNTATMKIIDYESLVSFSDWEGPMTLGKYLPKEDTFDATTFVWWQCVTMAFVWMKGLNADSLYTDTDGRGSTMEQFRTALLYDGVVPPWLQEHRNLSKGKFSTKQVKSFLKYMLIQLKARLTGGSQPSALSNNDEDMED